MATFPYISGAGNVAQMIAQLRKSFPSVVSADTVKKLGIASNNESYVINILQFIGLLDAESKKTQLAGQIFTKHKDEDFARALEAPVKSAYSTLFELHGDASWMLSDEDLITFFRQSDQTSDVIGRRQAGVFKILAQLSGHGEAPVPKASRPKTVAAAKKKASGSSRVETPHPDAPVLAKEVENSKLGLTVRVEINLPAGGTKDTYDAIFKSIRENLLNA
jgi:hypothetical protein